MFAIDILFAIRTLFVTTFVGGYVLTCNYSLQSKHFFTDLQTLSDLFSIFDRFLR